MKFLRYARGLSIPVRMHKNHVANRVSFTSVYRSFSSFDYKVDFKINKSSLNKYLVKLEKEYADLCQDSKHRSTARYMELHSVMQILNNRRLIVRNIDNLKELLQDKDDEIKQLAEEEHIQFTNALKKLDEQLLEALLPVSKVDSSGSIVLEVQAGVGGQEAMLFAKELFEMYCSYAEHKGWEVQIAEYMSTDIGGIRHATALISGPSVFQYIKHEAGIHRVQRIPSTEKGGRIHTSTVSVVILPQPDDIEVNVNQRDLKIETKRSTGAGGQHVNTTDSAVRIVHLPTGISVECQVDRSQIKNKKMAMARLTALLYQRELDSQTAEIEASRKIQVQTRNRNEKIRTYNFAQDRITDHRLQSVNFHNLKGFLEGGESLDSLINQLDKQSRLDDLLHILNDYE